MQSVFMLHYAQQLPSHNRFLVLNLDWGDLGGQGDCLPGQMSHVTHEHMACRRTCNPGRYVGSAIINTIS